MNLLNPISDRKEILSISILGLAHLGDCVYELMVRTNLTLSSHTHACDLHRCTVKAVNAAAQADGVKKVLSFLSEDEMAVYKRGRNAKVNSIPHNASLDDYHSATGLEALFGWLYLQGMNDRLNFLFKKMFDIEDY